MIIKNLESNINKIKVMEKDMKILQLDTQVKLLKNIFIFYNLLLDIYYQNDIYNWVMST